MNYLLIRPTTYTVRPENIGQNPYSETMIPVNKGLALKQHTAICKALPRTNVYEVKPLNPIPDIVYVANGGFSLPRLPEPVVVLPWMKYKQRRNELGYLKAIFDDLKIRTIPFSGSAEAPFEGGAEAKWFHDGKLLLVGYGYRTSKQTVPVLRRLLNSIYKAYGVEPPTVVGIRLRSDLFYHLDFAMAVLGPSSCMVNADAFESKELAILQKLLGKTNVHVISTKDLFAMNMVVTKTHILCHKLTDPTLKKQYEQISGKKVLELDVSEFEKGGGSVGCCVMPIYQ